MLVLARGGVGSPAVAKLDCEVDLVVPDDVPWEHCDVAVGRLYIEVPEECGADVDRQTVVDEVGGE